MLAVAVIASPLVFSSSVRESQFYVMRSMSSCCAEGFYTSEENRFGCAHLSNNSQGREYGYADEDYKQYRWRF
jgi:hypothetical protein